MNSFIGEDFVLKDEEKNEIRKNLISFMEFPSHKRDGSHPVHIYSRDESVALNVSSWIREPLLGEGGAVVISTPEHASAIRLQLQKLGIGINTLERSGRLVFLDAEETLTKFMANGLPNRESFIPLVKNAINSVRQACFGSAEIRAWGEMVNILYHASNLPAAIELENLWNEIIEAEGIELLCSYKIEEPDEASSALANIKSTHSSFFTA